MGLNLIDTVESHFTDSTIGAIGGQLGLAPTTAKAGSTVLIPLVLASMAKIATQQGGIENLQRIVRSSQPGGLLIDQLPAMYSSGKADEIPVRGSELIAELLGEDSDTLVALVSKQLGLKATALRSLWTMLTPLIVDVIACEVASRKWRPSEFRSRLMSGQNGFAKALPPAAAELLGLTNKPASRGPSETKSRGLDTSYVIAFIVSAITVFALSQYVLKRAQVQKTAPVEPHQVPADATPGPADEETVPDVVPTGDTDTLLPAS